MDKPLTTIGRAELLGFPALGIKDVPARVDTGAKTSSLWVSDIREDNGTLEFRLFAKQSPYYTGELHQTSVFSKRLVANSTGQVEERYVVKLVVSVLGRKINASFTLSNRSNQAYPVLIGRNILRGKFIVDVRQGRPQLLLERKKEILKKDLYNEQLKSAQRKGQ